MNTPYLYSQNLNNFKESLKNSARKEFEIIKANHKGEKFYSFALYTSDSFNYFSTTAASDEQFQNVLKNYRGSNPGTYDDYDADYYSLKWSPCDSPIHDETEIIKEVDESLSVIKAENGIYDNEDSEFGWLRYMYCVEKIALEVLAELDEEGIFGIGADREKVAINLLMGDQSNEDRLKYAAILNPKESFIMYEKEMKES